MLACALITRLPLLAALGSERRELLGRPVALAPEPDGPQAIGDASGAAEAFGVRAGMGLAEALARCPALVLVPPDPARAEAIWERALRRLEGIGAAVEPGRAGEAFFATEPLQGLYGDTGAVLGRARRALAGEVAGRHRNAALAGGARGRRHDGALPASVRLGAGPGRLCAFAAASRARPRRPPPIADGLAARRLLASLPVAILRHGLAWPRQTPDGGAPSATGADRRDAELDQLDLPGTLERLGVRTLGELAALPAAAVADRFGELGLSALRLARGAEEPLHPRRPPAELCERIELPEAASGPQLERALELLVDRLLAAPARGARTLRRLRLEARLAGGGGWRTEVALRSASAEAERLRLALTPRLAALPAPAASLALRATELGPEAAGQTSLARSPREERRARLAEAVRQARAAAGRDAVLRVLEVDPASRVPERRAILAPFLGDDRGDDSSR